MQLPTATQSLSHVRRNYDDTADVLTVRREERDEYGYAVVYLHLRVLRTYVREDRGVVYNSALGPDAGAWLVVRFQRAQVPAEDQLNRFVWCRPSIDVQATECGAVVASGRLMQALSTGGRCPRSPEALAAAARRLGAFPVRERPVPGEQWIDIVDEAAPELPCDWRDLAS